MNCQNEIAALLPFYVAGSLDASKRLLVDHHLKYCADCQAELLLWNQVGQSVVDADESLPSPSAVVLERVLVATKSTKPNPLQQAWQLVRYQIPLVRKDIWLPSAVVIAIGFLVAILMNSVDRASVILQILAPLISVAGITAIYGTENDPGLELALATPTSPRQVLMARMVIVFGYDLLLVLVATVGLLVFVPVDLLGTIIIAWLGPMTFLSALALILSLYIGTSNGIAVATTLWMLRWIASGIMAGGTISANSGPGIELVAKFYQCAWDDSTLLIGLAIVMVMLTMIVVGRSERFINTTV